MTRLQRLTDAIHAIEKNVENLKETLEELKSKSFTGIQTKIKQNTYNDALFSDFVDYVKSNYSYVDIKEYESGTFNYLEKLLDDKETGLKAITFLWEHISKAAKEYILFAIFPWQKNNVVFSHKSIERKSNEPINIADWLKQNYLFEMVEDFLNNKADLNY